MTDEQKKKINFLKDELGVVKEEFDRLAQSHAVTLAKLQKTEDALVFQRKKYELIVKRMQGLFSEEFSGLHIEASLLGYGRLNKDAEDGLEEFMKLLPA